MTDDPPPRPFKVLPPTADVARPNFRPHMPIYQPGDPRIQQDLLRGAGVGVDITGLSTEEQVRFWRDRHAEMFAVGKRLRVDPVREANLQMMYPEDRYPQDEDENNGA